MQIGQAAQASGVSAKMIRHYESIGLIAPADRRDSNYRVYGPDDVHRLRFIRRARNLGFPVERIRDLLKLWSDRDRTSAEVKQVAEAHLAELDRKIADMQAMADTLRGLAATCDGSSRPDCPILHDLACGEPGAFSGTERPQRLRRQPRPAAAGA